MRYYDIWKRLRGDVAFVVTVAAEDAVVALKVAALGKSHFASLNVRRTVDG